MTQVIMLTKNGCPQCVAAKMVLEKALQNKYASNITTINKETQTQEFETLVQQHGILSLPVFICNNTVLKNTSPSNIIAFFNQHLSA